MAVELIYPTVVREGFILAFYTFYYIMAYLCSDVWKSDHNTEEVAYVDLFKPAAREQGRRGILDQGFEYTFLIAVKTF